MKNLILVIISTFLLSYITYAQHLTNNNKFRDLQTSKENAKFTFYKPTTALLDNGQTRYTYSYDSNGNILTELVSTWNSSAWMDYTRVNYTYDTQNNLITEFSELWSNTKWVNAGRHTYTYDSQGNKMTDLYEFWATNAWVNFSKFSYTYDIQGCLMKDLYERWVIAAWKNVYCDTCTYDSNGNELIRLKKSWSNLNTWIDSERNTYTYDTQGNRITFLNEFAASWKNEKTIWVGNYYTTYTYDELGNRLTEFHTFNEANLGWTNSHRFNNTYDSQGNKLSQLLEIWNDSVWVNSTRSLYTYDINYNCTLGELNEWLSNSWQPSSGALTIYYNNSTQSLNFTAGTVTVEYTTFSDVNDEINISNSFALSQNYPNPFNPCTTILFDIPKSEFVTLKVYDILGTEVTTLVNCFKNAGFYKVNFDGSKLSSGTYFYRLEVGTFSETKKLILLK